MARLPRLAVAGHLHHVLLRSHGAQPAFVDDTDRQEFLSLLREAALAERVPVHGYVLLDGEVRLLATPPDTGSLSRLMQQLGRRYGARFNRRHARSGSLWAGRFKSSVVEPVRWALRCLRRVEGLPVERGLVARAGDYAWSSAAHHAGVRRDALVSEHSEFWRLGNTPFERELRWREFTEHALTSSECAEMDAALEGGWALGDPEFLRALEQKTERRVQQRARGRPSKRRADMSPKMSPHMRESS